MRHTSLARARYLRSIAKFRKEFKASRPLCEAGIVNICTYRSTDIHEIQTRARGGSLTNPENLMCLCRPCHDWITTHPAEATAVGWMRSAFGPSNDDEKPEPYESTVRLTDDIDALPW